MIIGIGNPYLQDDRAGLVVAKRLSRQLPTCPTECIYSAGLEIIDKVRGYERAIIVDACRLGYAPGVISEVSMDDILTSRPPINSHTVALGSALKTGYACFPGEMPKDIRIFLIEVKELEEFNLLMSPEVEQSVDKVVNAIKTLLLDTFSSENKPTHP